MNRIFASLFVFCAACLIAPIAASADPLPLEVLKFQHLPLSNGFVPVPSVARVPEPSTMLLMSLGGVALVVAIRQRAGGGSKASSTSVHVDRSNWSDVF